MYLYLGRRLIGMKNNIVSLSIILIIVLIVVKKVKEDENKVDDINEEIY